MISKPGNQIEGRSRSANHSPLRWAAVNKGDSTKLVTQGRLERGNKWMTGSKQVTRTGSHPMSEFCGASQIVLTKKW
jgi:hypothetical protein